MTKYLPTFETDKAGLALLLARRGVKFVPLELIQNALDEATTRIDVELTRTKKRNVVLVRVEDNSPAGFADLSHAYTLIARSRKGADPVLRGRFNLGEKLVVTRCDQATISTTTGTVSFNRHGRRVSREKRERGSVFSGTLKMTEEERCGAVAAARLVNVPAGVTLWVNGVPVPQRTPIAKFAATLQTERADDEGYLRRTSRETWVYVYEAPRGEAWLYELGIPVVRVDCAFSIDVHQKVPLNIDRDNVTPAYLRELLALVLSHAHAEMQPDQMSAAWVGEALESRDVSADAVRAVVKARYGEQRVIADPSDREGTKLAVSMGYAVIQAGSFSGAQWENIRRSGAALPAGQVTPSPKAWSSDPDAPTAEFIDPAEWSEAMRRAATYARAVAAELIGRPIGVRFANTTNSFAACYGRANGLVFNLRALRRRWFDDALDDASDLDALLIHELAHDVESDHLSARYHDELCRLGARLRRATSLPVAP